MPPVISSVRGENEILRHGHTVNLGRQVSFVTAHDIKRQPPRAGAGFVIHKW